MASRANEIPEADSARGAEAGIAEADLRARADWLAAEFLPHRPWLQRWVAHRFPHELDIDDIVQESFERILGRGHPGPIDNARGYLGRTAHSILVSRVRRRRIVEIELSDDLDAFGLRCASPLPDQQVAARGDLGRADAALAALPERTRQIVLLRRIEEMPQRDAAALLGLSVSAVEKHLRRGVKAIREQILCED